MRRAAALIGLAVLLGAGVDLAGGADAKMHACTLLTPAEVNAAVGGSAGPPQESDLVVSEGPSKGDTMGVCTWRTGAQSTVSVAVIRAATGAAREAGLAKLSQVFDTLKAQGWTEERKDFPTGRCAVMTPPASAKAMPLSTGCFAEAKGMGLSVGHSGTARVPMDKVRALLDKAIGRLP
jgi:hypothetical protein